MSKILIILASFLMLFPCCGLWGKENKKPHNETQTETKHHEPEAQKPPLNVEIIYDKTSNGDRTIRTKYIYSRYGSGEPSLRMEVVKHSDGKLSWSLDILFIARPEKSYLPKGGRMLIKLDDGEVVELKQSMKIMDTYISLPSSIPYTHGSYSITENYIKKIVTNRVTKVRIETSLTTTDSYIDFDYKNWNRADDITFSDVVAAEYKALLKKLDTKEDFYSDF